MKDMLLQLIHRIGSKSEFNLYLDLFHKIPKIEFAVIKISGQSLSKNLTVIAEDIAYLNKLDIFPVLIHGAGTELDKAFSNSRKINGIRITRKEDINKVISIFNDLNEELTQRINELGGSADKCGPVFNCQQLLQYGLVGQIKQVNRRQIEELVNRKVTPVISPLGMNDGQYLNINADTAAKELVRAIQPRKLIMLTETGGILDRNGAVISFINVSFKEKLKGISGGMALKVQEISEFLKDGLDCSVVITSPRNLLKEIFTIRGGGTFIKYHHILSTTHIESLNKQRIIELLEDAFDKNLQGNYINREISEVIYQKDYEGIAIITHIDNIPYLDKFAVAKFRQGTGLGKSLWTKVIEKYPRLIWRAKPRNPLNIFYMKNCHGLIKDPRWYVYWRNLKRKEILSRVAAVINQDESFIEKGVKTHAYSR